MSDSSALRRILVRATVSAVVAGVLGFLLIGMGASAPEGGDEGVVVLIGAIVLTVSVAVLFWVAMQWATFVRSSRQR